MRSVPLLLALFLLAVSAGYFTGRTLAAEATEIRFVPDTRPPVPVVSIVGVRNGLLHGTITGQARVQLGDVMFVQSGAFALDATSLLRNEVLVSVPSYANFVASKRGKKYYEVLSAAGERIVPANRLYFSTAKEAELAGYRP